MKFLYKIYSRYDGFTPDRIPQRLLDGRLLSLSWTKYIDILEKGLECWIYFHGPHEFENGVYVKGAVAEIRRDEQCVLLRVRKYDTHRPLTDPATSNRIAEVVSVRYRQVFLWPDQWDHVPDCTIESCRRRLCDNCPTWNELLLIDETHHRKPERLSGRFLAYVPAYWIIPSRCYIYREGKTPKQVVYRATHMFGNFKVGERGYAYPLALGIYRSLLARELVRFDAIVPIPLSPDKAEAGEEHRTRNLARELSRLLGAPVREVLILTSPISKRAMQSQGYTVSAFERAYFDALGTKGNLYGATSVLLVDDVATRGKYRESGCPAPPRDELGCRNSHRHSGADDRESCGEVGRGFHSLGQQWQPRISGT